METGVALVCTVDRSNWLKVPTDGTAGLFSLLMYKSRS